MSARNPANLAAVANELAHVSVLSIFHEWTPADAMLCALVQNRFDGLFGGVNEHYWSAGYITSIQAIRTSFITGA
jgi:hypothetical protein